MVGTDSTITSLENPGNSVLHGVGEFQGEAVCVKDLVTTVPRTLYPVSDYLGDIRAHFSRPTGYKIGTLNTTPRGLIFDWPCSTPLTLLNQYPAAINKILFSAGIRYTAVFTLTVSATPFIRGLFALCWQYGFVSGITLTFDRAGNAQTATNLPHARLDLSETTTVQLRVPFLATAEYASLYEEVATSSPYGTLSFVNLTNFDLPVGASAPSYVLYTHFEDVELFGANPATTSNLLFQSGFKSTSSAINKETDSMTKPVSTILTAASTMSTAMGSLVPSLKSVFGPTTWFLAQAARAASYFGFSKPTVLTAVKRVHNIPSIAEHNVDLPTPSLVVGPLSTNRLGFDATTTQTDVDEMSIDFVKSQYSQLTILDWASTQTGGTVLGNIALSPAHYWFRLLPSPGPQFTRLPPAAATASATAFQPTSLMNLCSYFKFWRGGIKFRFTFVKTKFHAGRVQFAVAYGLYPANNTGLGSPSYIVAPNYSVSGPQAQGFNIVFNLKDSNVCEFTVPYVSSEPYTNFVAAIGSLRVFVVDPLQVTGVVSNSIQVLVEVCGAEDFEPACYSGPMWCHTRRPASVNPFAAATLSQTALSDTTPQDDEPPPDIEFQSGHESVVSLTPPFIVQNTIGERISSLKQLAMIPHRTSVRVTAEQDKIVSFIRPWWWYPQYQSGSIANFGKQAFAISGQISSLYAFVRGGTDAHFYATPDRNSIAIGTTFTVYQDPRPVPQNFTYTGDARDGTSGSSAFATSGSAGYLHVRLPAYQRRVRWSPDMGSITDDWGYEKTNLAIPAARNWFPNALYTSVTVAPPGVEVSVATSASDDAYGHMYIGPMPFVLITSGGTEYDPDALRVIPP